MSYLELSHVQKSFGIVKVVHDFNMSINEGEFVPRPIGLRKDDRPAHDRGL